MKRGQAAMEFLMTYGWAILVVLIAIGALAYFGVLNPARFLPASCTLTPGLACNDFVIDGTGGNIQLVLQNGMGVDLSAMSILVTSDAGTSCTLAGRDPMAGSGSCASTSALSDGETCVWESACAIQEAVKSRFKADVVVSYTTAGGLVHSKTGSITTQVE